MICSPFSRRGPSPAAEARSRRAQGGSRTRQGRSEAEDGEAVARARRPAQDSANSRGDLRRGRIDPGNHRGQAVELTLRSEEHTSELQSLMRISYAVFCLKKTTAENRSVHWRRGRAA